MLSYDQKTDYLRLAALVYRALGRTAGEDLTSWSTFAISDYLILCNYIALAHTIRTVYIHYLPTTRQAIRAQQGFLYVIFLIRPFSVSSCGFFGSDY